MSDAPATDIVKLGSGAMFDAIAPRYDLLNRVLSMGIDRRWRRRTVRALELGPAARVLDVATGTADVAIAVLAAHPDAIVTGVDPSENMLAIGRRKLARLGLHAVMERGDAQALPSPDGAFDAATIAFGIRNVPDRARGLAELRRVVRPGGRVAVLELSEPRGGILGPLARFHIRKVVPRLGALLSGARAYRYLQESIAAFPPPDEFAAMMRAAGLEDVTATPLTFGVTCLFVGRRP
jgi:demethylmenaquinone methyltransferase/2-methoxy-6-polyprenyl-1,4-benzoquinol methylase